jgi:exopolysaccharide biosynthesis polyprenyl glycosylphosphotransferase
MTALERGTGHRLDARRGHLDAGPWARDRWPESADSVDEDTIPRGARSSDATAEIGEPVSGFGGRPSHLTAVHRLTAEPAAPVRAHTGAASSSGDSQTADGRTAQQSTHPRRQPPSAPEPADRRAPAADRGTALDIRRRWERRYRRRLRWTDVLVVLVATIAPRAVLFFPIPALAPVETAQLLTGAFALPLLVAICWLVTLTLFRSREAAVFGSGRSEYTRVLGATGLAFGALAATFVVVQADGLRLQLLVSLPLGLLLLLVGRWGWRRWLLHERLFGHYVSRTLVVGDARDVEYVIEALHRDGQRAHLVVGAVLTGDRPGISRQTPLVVDGRPYPVVGCPRTAARTAAELAADTIIVVSHDDADPYYVKRLSWELEGTAAELILGSRLADVAGPRISLRPVDGLPLIQVRIPTFDGGQFVLKRALDIVVALVGLVAVALVMIPLAILIPLDSPGPLFYRQERIGRDGKSFRMVKFRTMRVGAHAEAAALAHANDGAGPLFKMREDPRVTRVGRVLRRLSLDELPQFWNVLRGDMSAVGPRPPLPEEVLTYSGVVSRRLYIKPGITGLWQISGRSDLSWDESVRLDLRYVENWSLLSDLIIMWRTVRVMFFARGAY